MKKKYLILCCLSVLGLILSGCSSTHRKDGPPPFPVDISRIPNAVPKVEPLSRIGNKPSYTVNGKKYYVMQSRKNYVATGIASWYGTLFDKHRTSNGEKYDMLAMTAAHKSLPLPTYVQVTNLENKRKIIVKVNDRGPFKQNRIIDLSFAAAKKLGMAAKGTALVEVRAIIPESFPLIVHHQPRPSLLANPCIIALRNKPLSIYFTAGQFHDKNAARQQAMNLARQFKFAPVKLIFRPSRHLYQVQIGPIRDRVTVERVAQHLKSMGLASKRIAYDI